VTAKIRSVSNSRHHLVLIPGFGGFDALGQVEYYAGVTEVFHQWTRSAGKPLMLHYFDNLPTAAVRTRAGRLGKYLAKRILRGQIPDDDSVVLVGHSTGGLDIRQLLTDLQDRPGDRVYADGGNYVVGEDILSHIDRVVFLSVPHWGTNIADWVRSHPVWRAAAVAKLRAAVAGSQVYLLDSVESQIAGGIACFTDADLLRAAKDALTEANANYGVPGPSRTAGAEEAASQLALYLRYMCSDFSVLDDLTASPDKRSPANFGQAERKTEMEHWRNKPIRTLSFATVGCRPFRFPSGAPAPIWELACPCTYPAMTPADPAGAGTDLSYRLCYRACAGGPFRWPEEAGKDYRVLGPPPPEPLEVWDNDGIVNTASMFWPEGEIVLVMADHLDIVGHYRLADAPPDPEDGRQYAPARKYRSYDALKSSPRLPEREFQKIWAEIFEFAIK
jgi:hypothetical protein